MNVDENIVHEILHEVFSSFETLETQSTAILQLLKDKGLASEQEIASHLEQAEKASNVRRRAVRARIEHLISSALETAERETKAKAPEPAEKSKESSNQSGAGTSQASQEKEMLNAKPDASRQKPQGSAQDKGAEKSENQAGKQNASETPRENGREHAA